MTVQSFYLHTYMIVPALPACQPLTRHHCAWGMSMQAFQSIITSIYPFDGRGECVAVSPGRANGPNNAMA